MRAAEDELKALMTAGLDGDMSAHDALLRALPPLLRRYYRRSIRDVDIEDLVQDTLIAIHQHRASYDRGRPFSAWLFAIARNKRIDHYRRWRATCSIEEFDDMRSGRDAEEAINAAIDVERLLASLPGKQAAAIRRTRLEGRSVVEAARAAGIGESDVKVSVHRGLKALAARLA